MNERTNDKRTSSLHIAVRNEQPFGVVIYMITLIPCKLIIKWKRKLRTIHLGFKKVSVDGSFSFEVVELFVWEKPIKLYSISIRRLLHSH